MRLGLDPIFWRSSAGSIGGGPYVQILDPPCSHLDVSKIKANLLVPMYEEGDCMVHVEILDL